MLREVVIRCWQDFLLQHGPYWRWGAQFQDPEQ